MASKTQPDLFVIVVLIVIYIVFVYLLEDLVVENVDADIGDVVWINQVICL